MSDLSIRLENFTNVFDSYVYHATQIVSSHRYLYYPVSIGKNARACFCIQYLFISLINITICTIKIVEYNSSTIHLSHLILVYETRQENFTNVFDSYVYHAMQIVVSLLTCIYWLKRMWLLLSCYSNQSLECLILKNEVFFSFFWLK